MCISFYMTTSDLILCYNLLVEEAENLEQENSNIVNDRKGLAERIKAEVDRRDLDNHFDIRIYVNHRLKNTCK